MSGPEIFSIAPVTLASYARTCLRLVHFAGLTLGFGGAVFLDLMFSRYRKTPVTTELADNVEWVSKFVALGLGLLWVSGLGFLVLYHFAEPEKLTNPKIWAKVVIVAILTLNGVAIHKLVIPFVRQRIGSQLLVGMTPRMRGTLVGCGVVSLVSWTMPVVLGTAPQLNFVVPCALILAGYAAVLGQAFLIANFLLRRASGNISVPASSTPGEPDPGLAPS
ncbi:hypothetical protein [Mesorhizobium sp.]|uniref:hypothetical protein n=1 Tax=Mesorhizobium sp. TaxID=1871066 RepID=UPI0025C424C2|nr:hypothetical protein [Mesorhizobium sp.]